MHERAPQLLYVLVSSGHQRQVTGGQHPAPTSGRPRRRLSWLCYNTPEVPKKKALAGGCRAGCDDGVFRCDFVLDTHISPLAPRRKQISVLSQPQAKMNLHPSVLKWLVAFCVLDGVAASEFDAIASPRTPRVLGWMTPPSSPPAPPTPPTSPPASPPLASVDLGTAEGFALLAKSGITTTGATEVTALSLSLPLARAPTPNPSPYPLPPTPYPYTPTPIPLYP